MCLALRVQACVCGGRVTHTQTHTEVPRDPGQLWGLSWSGGIHLSAPGGLSPLRLFPSVQLDMHKPLNYPPHNPSIPASTSQIQASSAQPCVAISGNSFRMHPVHCVHFSLALPHSSFSMWLSTPTIPHLHVLPVYTLSLTKLHFHMQDFLSWVLSLIKFSKDLGLRLTHIHCPKLIFSCHICPPDHFFIFFGFFFHQRFPLVLIVFCYSLPTQSAETAAGNTEMLWQATSLFRYCALSLFFKQCLYCRITTLMCDCSVDWLCCVSPVAHYSYML